MKKVPSTDGAFYFSKWREGFEPYVIPEGVRRGAMGASGDNRAHEVTLAALRIPPSPPNLKHRTDTS